MSLTHQSGSHKIFKHAQRRRVTVPYHAGTILPPRLLKRILRQADWAVKELLKRLH